jgi:hypothetical protein
LHRRAPQGPMPEMLSVPRRLLARRTTIANKLNVCDWERVLLSMDCQYYLAGNQVPKKLS